MSSNGARQNPVMADVARVAGVSHQTVSRVLNDHPNVRPATRERVLAAIEQLGYRRNSSARALVTRRTQTLGVVAFDTRQYGPASTLLGIEQAAREAGYFVSIVSLKAVSPQAVREALDYLTEQSVDGFIVIAPQRSAAEALAYIPTSLPAVAVEGGQADDMPVVCVDQHGGTTAAVRHLLGLGHRTVWHVAGPSEWLEAEARLEGWRAALRAAGAAAPEPLYGDWSPRSGYAAGRRLAERVGGSDGPTAVFVANDQMALGLLRAFGERGIRVPEQISVVGFDDIPEAEFFSPPLTTVYQDFAAVGRRGMRLLLDQIDGGAGRATGLPRVVVPARLVVRSSTAPAAGTG
ncbi:LacI family DNA-binding transcriptional regulator [Allonocardiopsis opalescens]|uniref:LacI family transcriptional regulator n=1 Tax=Allonocardiopsis opalescens TaxID=1144618 RepID=A0A2T0QEI2_9ACTN|nr:LacI family DNA-binding transcriptional regulator [Allonocardiopsis opalescens]PRY02290.1 LacI family transcriptional regulator [Allonocardiopsis opalescens]